MISFLYKHPIDLLIAGIGLYFLFSNAVMAMEEPTEKSTPRYRYAYRFLHGVAGNLRYALRAKFPSYIPDGAVPPSPPSQ